MEKEVKQNSTLIISTFNEFCKRNKKLKPGNKLGRGFIFNQLPKIGNVAFIKDEIAFILNDGRVIYTYKLELKIIESNYQSKTKF